MYEHNINLIQRKGDMSIMKKNKNKILIVVDMQKDFTSGVLGNAECEAAVQEVVKVINSNQYDEIYLTRDTHHNDYLETQEGKNLPVEHCIEFSDGWKIRQEIMEAVKDKKVEIVNKPSFGSLFLAEELKNKYFNEMEKVEVTLVGVCTGICVISNAMLIKATLPETKINVIEKACACVTLASHKNAIEAMKMCQINII